MTDFTKPFSILDLNPVIVAVLMLLMQVPSSLLANNYMSLSYNKEGRKYINSASIIDLDQNREINTVDLGQTLKYPVEIIALKDKSKRYFYLSTGKTSAQLKVFDASTLTHQYTLKIEPLDRIVVQLITKSFIDVSEDLSKLYIQTAVKKSRKILIYNNQTGDLLHQVSLVKGKSFSALSNNGEYIITQSKSNKNATLYDADNLNVVSKVSLKPKRSLSFNYKEYLFINTAVLNRRKSPNKFEILNLNTLETTGSKFKTNGKTVYFEDEKNNKLYIAARKVKTSELILMEFSEGKLSSIDTKGIKLYPQGILVHEDSDKLLILGLKKNVLLDLNNPDDSVLMKHPFDAINTIWNPKKQRIYLREGSGSEVAVFDTQSGQKLGRSGTGRAGVKFGQFMASVAISAVSYGYGYISYSYKLSSTQMMLNANEDKLYVINSKTNDVTQFNASDLTGRQALATGGGTALIYQHENNNDNLFVLSSKKASIINDKDFSMIKQFKYDDIIGLDFEESIIFVKQKKQYKVFSMIDGSFLATLPVSENVKSIVPLNVE